MASISASGDMTPQKADIPASWARHTASGILSRRDNGIRQDRWADGKSTRK
jgi:hypothetical protein